MRTSYAVSLQKTGFQAVAFQQSVQPLLQNIKELGFSGIELAVRDPSLLDWEELETTLDTVGLPVCALGTGQAFLEEGLHLSALDGDTSHRTIDRLRKHIELAESLQALVIIGLIRGNLPSGAGMKEKALERFQENMAVLANEAFSRDVRLVIEPLNRYEVNFLHTVEETLTLINALSVNNVGVLADTYHMNIEEVDMAASLRMAGEKLWHVHVADSNRLAPGMGHLDFPPLIDTLRGMEYTGYVSAEIIPRPNPEDAARNTMSFFRSINIGV